ncbi:hypothetical protein HDU99_007852 [Rhizoclosmatium hyalinum]|nr:hypothetical protein HDU99_007852 [Rhizoclosmatium hyalinum]
MDSLDSAGNLFRAAAGVVVGDIPTVVRRKASSDSGLSARPLPEMSREEREEREERELRMKAMREEYLMQREGVYLGSPNPCPVQNWEADAKESDSVPKTKKTNFMWFGKSRSGRSPPDSM